MKKIDAILPALIIWLVSSCSGEPKIMSLQKPQETAENMQSDYDSLAVKRRFNNELIRVKKYIARQPNSYSNQRAILIDMHVSSKYYRLFVVDLKKDSIISRGMVAHGSGSEIEGTDSLQFSNTPNSYMTSLGLYKIGASYQGSFGRSYKLHGLETTNNKAFARAVVLHRYQCVPDGEQYYPICNSLGCAMVSENYFESLEKIIDAEKKPVILSIYY